MAGDGVPTVLVVEDDPQVRSLSADYLGADYDVATAASWSRDEPVDGHLGPGCPEWRPTGVVGPA